MASETPSDAGWAPWEPRTVKHNTTREAAKRVPTIRKLGPPPGTFVEVQLRPADGDHEPISAINKIDKYGNFFFKGGIALPAGWPELTRPEGKRKAVQNSTDYVARYRVVSKPEVAKAAKPRVRVPAGSRSA